MERDRLLRAAHEQHRDGDVLSALRTCAELMVRARTTSDYGLMADAATVVRRPIDPLLRARAHALAAEALVHLSKDAALRARVHAQLLATRNPFARPDEPYNGPPRDVEAAFLELQSRAAVLQSPHHAAERMKVGRQAVSLGRACGNSEYECWGRSWVMDAHAVSGNRAELLDELAELIPVADRPHWRCHVLLTRATQTLLDGRFTDTLILADEARNVGGDAAYLHLPFAFAVGHATGDQVEQLLSRVREAVESLPFQARGWLCLALIAANRREEAREVWQVLAPHVSAVPQDASEFLIATVGHARVCTELGDTTTAVVLYDRLRPFAGLHAIGHAHTPYEGPVDLSLGILARLLGRAEADGHLRAALEDCQAIQATAHQAVTLTELAELASPHTRSRREYAEAGLAIAERLGMRPLTDRLHAFLCPPDRLDPALTPRESEIAARVADGLSNAAIAAQLVLSERTVENHVSRSLLKLGLGSRTALAIWHMRHRPM